MLSLRSVMTRNPLIRYLIQIAGLAGILLITYTKKTYVDEGWPRSTIVFSNVFDASLFVGSIFVLFAPNLVQIKTWTGYLMSWSVL